MDCCAKIQLDELMKDQLITCHSQGYWLTDQFLIYLEHFYSSFYRCFKQWADIFWSSLQHSDWYSFRTILWISAKSCFGFQSDYYALVPNSFQQSLRSCLSYWHLDYNVQIYVSRDFGFSVWAHCFYFVFLSIFRNSASTELTSVSCHSLSDLTFCSFLTL